MAQIKAAFFDIDGTLLPFHAKALPESTVQALAALRENGVKTFIATGRPPVHLPYLHALDGIPFDGYVTMNGQYCYLPTARRCTAGALTAPLCARCCRISKKSVSPSVLWARISACSTTSTI